MKLYSLRRATFTALFIPAVLAMVLVAVSGLISANRAVSTLRDHEMEQEGAFLLMLSLHEATEGETLGVIRSSESYRLQQLRAGGTGFRIWSDDTIMTTTGSLPASQQTAPDPGFADVAAGGSQWRRFALRHPTLPVTVEVVEPTAMRNTLTWRMAASLIGPMVLLIIAVSLIASYQIASALRPMEEISRDIDARDSEDLRPIGGRRIPKEIAPLLVAVNDLMKRLRSAIEREREFTDNAAHELRTPLAALKTRAQIAERALADHPNQQAELSSLSAAVDRATGVIEQLLMLSRLQGGHAHFDRIDLSRLTEDVARELAIHAIAKNQDMEARIAPGVIVRGNDDSLRMVLRNLIDNAIRYAQAKGHISIELGLDESGRALLSIADDGPGIPPDRLERAFERFTRFSHGEQGSGLGLSIVERVVHMHGGTITLRLAEPTGLICDIRLPT